MSKHVRRFSEKEVAAFKERMQQRDNNNAEHQAYKAMGKDARRHAAADWMAGKIAENAKRSGQNITHEQAVKAAAEIAERANKKQDG